MLNRSLYLTAILLFGCMLGFAQTKKADSTVVVVKESFDPKSDPTADLDKAIGVASKTGRNILLDVGGEWCIWCRRLDKFFHDNPDVSGFLHENYVTIKVNYSKENENKEFLSKYPTIPGYPHIFILDGTGKLLHSQDTGKLETGDHHDHDKVLAFLKEWAPIKKD